MLTEGMHKVRYVEAAVLIRKTLSTNSCTSAPDSLFVTVIL